MSSLVQERSTEISVLIKLQNHASTVILLPTCGFKVNERVKEAVLMPSELRNGIAIAAGWARNEFYEGFCLT
jgi:hypothetical protein